MTDKTDVSTAKSYPGLKVLYLWSLYFTMEMPVCSVILERHGASIGTVNILSCYWVMFVQISQNCFFFFSFISNDFVFLKFSHFFQCFFSPLFDFINFLNDFALIY